MTSFRRLTSPAFWLLAFALMAATSSLKADTVQVFAAGSAGLTADGSYGPNGGQGTSDWVDCAAYVCDGRTVAVGGTGAVDVIWECKAQLTDTDEQAFPCYGQTTMTDATVGLYVSLARAGYYRMRLINRASGTFKGWVSRVKR